MSDQDIIDLIAAHRGRERGMVCDEGELWCDGCGCIIRDDEWPHHTLTALRERYAVVELPTGETLSCGRLGMCTQFDAPNDIGGVSGMHGGTVSDSESEWTPDEARSLAAALLAAADKAEGGE